MKRIVILLFFCISIHSNLSYADACIDTTPIPKNFLFPETFKSAQLLSKELCLIANQTEPNFLSAKPVADAWKDAAMNESKTIRDIGVVLKAQIDKLYEAILDGLPFKNFEVDKTNLTYSVSGSNLQVIADNEKCKTTRFKVNCYEVLDQLRVALNTTNNAVNATEITRVSESIGLYSELWGNYFEKARSQTFLELSVNTYLYRDQLKKDEFVPPPDYQVIFLHPSIALEYISDADDGEEQSEALVIEWLGINWWDMKVPFGVSFITSYSDRDSVDDVGMGLMFHVNNNYSIGITDHDGDHGVLVTLDLLKLFEDKKSNLEKFKAKAEQYYIKQ